MNNYHIDLAHCIKLGMIGFMLVMAIAIAIT